MGVLRKLGVAAHRAAFSTPATAALYVSAWRGMRRLPLPVGVVARVANAANAAAHGRGNIFAGPRATTVRTPAGSVRLMLRPQDFGFRPLVSRSLQYEDDVFRLLASRLHRYDAVIEIGANVGVFTTAIGRRFQADGKPLGRIVAFEPAESSFGRLRANLALNGLDAVHAVRAAVSDADGEAAFYETAPFGTASSLHRTFGPKTAKTETRVPTVDAARLGSFVPGAARTLVKIDAEGHEAIILGRMGAFVQERRPDLIVEILRSEAAKIGAAVEGWGYRASRIKAEGLVDEPLSSADHHSRDWLLSPIT